MSSFLDRLNSIEMNSSLNSSNSDEMMELNWTADITTPCKSPTNNSMMDVDGSPATPPSSISKRRSLVALKLLDTPCTPRSLLRRASQTEIASPKSNCSSIKSHYQTRRRSSARISALKRSSTPSPVSPIYNPFQCSTPIPTDELPSEKKRRRLNCHNEEDLEEIKVSLFNNLRQKVPVKQPKRQARMVLDLNQSRYKREFKEKRLIGKGEFGEVYQCQNKMDRCHYALKRLIKPIAGSLKEASALREVYAHAVLGKHQHILQYYSAWAEDKHMIIQNEFCNGGSLNDVIQTNIQESRNATEDELRQILIQVAKGLRYMHSMNLVHLDIKPGNIFISHREVTDDEDRKGTCYKIGDLGMVTSLTTPVVEDGDSRYLPRELLDDDYSNLTKADVFSLALTVYEVATLEQLPQNGPEWHSIRDGKLEPVETMSTPLFNLIIRMISKTPSRRPSPAMILKEKFILSVEKEQIYELTRKLNEEKIENQRLLRKLAKAADATPRFSASSSRLVGQHKLNRSMSIA